MFYQRRKCYSIICLIVFMTTFTVPSGPSWATEGPAQNEYTSYETPGQGDFVNLLTGNFNFNQTVMVVPGAEMTFPINLFYNSGIRPEQEASWVGLGWNLNVGAISRQVIGYPDDAYDQAHSINVNEPGGGGYAHNFIVYKKTWDTERGHGGGISLFNILGVDWNEKHGLSSGTVLGLNFNKDGIKGYWAENVFNVALAVATALSLGSAMATPAGSASSATAAANSAASGMTAAKAAALQAAAKHAATAVSLLSGALNQGKFSSTVYNWSHEIETSNLGYTTRWRYWLDDTRSEHGFGTLYLGSTNRANFTEVCPDCPTYYYKSPRIVNNDFDDITNRRYVDNFKMAVADSKIASHDMYRHVEADQDYIDVNAPSHISKDLYSVMGPGISGAISPIRTDIGNLCFPKKMTNTSRSNVIPFAEESSSNKVQFIYPADPGNNYLFHDVDQTGVQHHIDNSEGGHVYLRLDDSRLQPGATRQADRPGLVGGRLLRSKDVLWYTNEEIAAGTVDGLFGVPGIDRTYMPAKGIGGFVVTDESGQRYHYGLPVYSRRERNYSGKVGEEATKYALHKNDERVAQSWLLTAITGSDYHDANGNGRPDNDDTGAWVNFDYGRYTTWYTWRTPYIGQVEQDGQSYFSKGEKELYYLNRVSTRTHSALFIKGIRKDGRGAYHRAAGMPPVYEDYFSDKPISQLYLDRIVLLKNEDYRDLLAAGFVSTNQRSETAEIRHSYEWLTNVHDVYDANRNWQIRNILANRPLQTVVFNYETDPARQLCGHVPSSFDDSQHPPATDHTIYHGRLGKLTLNSLSVLGSPGTKQHPDYEFEYGYNPDYHEDRWGGWGMYNRNGTSGNHAVSGYDDDGAAWSLSKITLPLGAQMRIAYERDDYASVSGYPVTERKGGDIRVSKLEVTDGNEVYRTRYIYTNDGTAAGSSSGVVSKEPDHIKTGDNYGLDKVYDYPSTSVFYGKVSVLHGDLATDADYHTRQVYEFTTPHHSDVQVTQTTEQDYRIPGWRSAFSDHVYYRQHFNKVTVNTARVGSIQRIRTYDQQNNLKNSRFLFYTPGPRDHIGKYSEGSLTFEFVQAPNGHDPASFNFQRTSKVFHPYYLSVVSEDNSEGLSVQTVNTDRDFITGIPKRIYTSSGTGQNRFTEKVLAYEVYPEMGFRQENPAYAHKGGSTVAAYTYKYGSTGAPQGLLGASVQLWKNHWNTYRTPDGTGDIVDAAGPAVWRKATTYAYQSDGTDAQADGTLVFADSDKFDFAAASHPGWQQGPENLRYDIYSMPLEHTDFEGNYVAVKTNPAKDRKIMEVANARYTEAAYTGAEGEVAIYHGTKYLDSEVRIGADATLYPYSGFTGTQCVKIGANGARGFYYKMAAGEFDPGRDYRLSVWVKDDPDKVALYYAQSGTRHLLGTQITPYRGAGNWSKVEAIIPAAALNGTGGLEAGCLSTAAGSRFIDDFIFAPREAALTGYVYDDEGRIHYTTNEENLFTEYQYNDKGQLIHTYHSVLIHGEITPGEREIHYSR